MLANFQGHGKPVDWWAFGVFVFEMVAGFPPFYDEDITSTYKKILGGKFNFPSHFSASCRDLIRKLLQVIWNPGLLSSFSLPTSVDTIVK